jgi:hypothetical protein
VKFKPYHQHRRARFGNRLVRALVWFVLAAFVLTSVGAIFIVAAAPH